MEKNIEIFRTKCGMDFSIFYKMEEKKLKNFLKYKFSNIDHFTIDDIVSMSFIKLLENINKFDATRTSLKTYFYTISLNIAKKYSKNNYIIKVELNDDVIIHNDNCLLEKIEKEEEEKIKNIKLKIIDEEIKRMGDKYREILELRISNLKYNEIAEVTKLNISTVKSRLRKARNILKKKVTSRLVCQNKNFLNYDQSNQQ